jgi:hypothetical protein
MLGEIQEKMEVQSKIGVSWLLSQSANRKYDDEDLEDDSQITGLKIHETSFGKFDTIKKIGK